MLQAQITKLELGIAWESKNNNWRIIKATIDGSLSLSSLGKLLPDLTDLTKATAIQFKGLNVLDLNLTTVDLDLALKEGTSIEFNLLGGLFACKLNDLKISKWSLGDLNKQSGTLSCQNANFEFKKESAFEVEIRSGKLDLVYDHDKGFYLKLPSMLGISAKIGEAVSFEGEVGWVDKEENGREVRYFFASGSCAFEGFPEVRALLKLGTLEKVNGEIAPNIVIYGDLDYEMELFAGVTTKKIGGGLGINNRLIGIDSDPTAEEIIENIKLIKPHQITSWKEVYDEGFYLSIVLSTLLASNRGKNNEVNAYVVDLVLSIDSNFNPVAAGRIWLSSSVDFVKKHYDNPALIGALALSSREKKLTVALRSQENPKLETNEFLQDLLNKTTIDFAFRLSPELVDYHLKEITYTDKLLGTDDDFVFRGSYRIAIYRQTMLVNASLHMQGHFDREFRAGPGGFRCWGDLDFMLAYGGLLSLRGINVYGMVDARLGFEVSAFIEIRFSISIKILGKRHRKSWTKRFSANFANLQIHVYGTVAFNDQSNLGFDGGLSASMRIAGYPLSLSPRLSHNAHVIHQVKGQVARFERALEEVDKIKSFHMVDSLTHRLFGEEPTRDRLSKQKDEPSWLYYRSYEKDESEGTEVTRHLLLPASRNLDDWYTPKAGNTKLNQDNFDFRDSVIKIAAGELGDPFKTTIKATIPQKPDEKIQLKAVLESGFGSKLVKGAHLSLKANTSSETTFQNIWVVVVRKAEGINGQITLILALDKDATPHDDLDFNQPVQNYKLVQPKVILMMPWYPFTLDDPVALDNPAVDDKTVDLVSMFYETAIPEKDVPEVESHFSLNQVLDDEATVVYDPRVESPSRDYLVREDRGLPEHALSYDFQPLDQVEALPSDDNMAEDLLYESLRYHQGKYLQHNAADPEPWEAQIALRSGLTKRLLDEFNQSNADEALFLANKEKTISGTHFYKGFVIENLDPDDRFDEILVQRQADKSLICRRVDVETTTDRSGQNQPNDFNDRIRTLPIRQKFTRLNDGAREEAKVKVKLPLKIDKTLIEDDSLSKAGFFEIYRRFPFEDEKTLISSFVVPNISQYTKADGTKYLIVEPFIYTDEFEVENRQFVHKRLLSDSSEVEYFLRFKLYETDRTKTKEGHIKTEESVSDYLAWAPVRLHIPKPLPSLEDLSLVFPVSALVKGLESFGLFQLVKGEDRKPWQSEVPLEFWVSEKSMKQSGFYSGEVESEEDKSHKGYPTLDGLKADSSYESVYGKIKLELESSHIQGFLRIKRSLQETLFSDTRAYQFYCRYQGKHQEQNLVPLNLLLTQEISSSENEKRKYRAIGQIEWISNEHYEEAINRLNAKGQRNYLSPSEFIVLDQYDEQENQGKNYLDINFLHQDLNQGGVEIRIIDQDFPKQSTLKRVEVQERPIFIKKERDFRDQSKWEYVHHYFLSSETSSNPYSSSDEKSDETLEKRLYYDSDSVLISSLEDKAYKLIEKIDKISTGKYNWKDDYFTAAIIFLSKLEIFEYSPLNVGTESITTSIESIKNLIAQVLIGGDKEKTVLDHHKDIEVIEEHFKLQALTLDGELSRRLIGVLFRRFAVVNELFSASVNRDLNDLLPHPAQYQSVLPSNEQNEDLKLPNQKNWLRVNSEYQEIKNEFELPTTSSLLDKYGIKQLKDSGGKLKAKIKQLLEDLGLNQSLTANSRMNTYPYDLGRVVPYAKGLSKVIDQLENKEEYPSREGFTLDKRPHHTISIIKEKKKSIPAPINFKNFLSDRQRLKEVVSSKKEDQTDFNQILAHFNLLERLGFAVDLSLYTKARGQLSQNELFEEIQNATEDLKTDLADSTIVVVGGQAPNLMSQEIKAGLKASARTGFSFVKLAVIPKVLFEKNKQGKYENLEKILKYREIDLTKGNSEGKPIMEEGKEATYEQELSYFVKKMTELIKENALTQVFVTPANTRWQTLPAVGEVVKAIVPIQDGYGHRFDVLIQSLSRYEPLLDWHLGIKGQFKLDDYVDNQDKAHSVTVKPINYAAMKSTGSGIREQDLRVMNFQHPKLARFTYQLPATAAQAMKNQIAKVRTGYQGYDLVFLHQIIDKLETHDGKKAWEPVMKAIEFKNDSMTLPVKTKDAKAYGKTKQLIKLFDHERLLEIDQLPYFYRYYLNPRVIYDSHQLPVIKHQDKITNAATVEPAKLLSYAPIISKVYDPEDEPAYYDFNFKLFISRHRDYVDDLEKEPQPMSLAVDSKTIFVRDLPDLTTDYRILYRIKPDPDNDNDQDIYYLPVITLRMPWSEEHRPPSGEEMPKPRLTGVYQKFNIVSVDDNPTPKPKEENSEHKVHEASVKLFSQPIGSQNERGYWVQFTLRIAAIDAKYAFSNENAYYLRTERAGVKNEAIPVTVEAVTENTDEGEAR